MKIEKGLNVILVLATIGLRAMPLALLTGCGSASMQAKPEAQFKIESGVEVPSGAMQFLGTDATLLQPGVEGQAAYRYVASDVQFSNYPRL